MAYSQLERERIKRDFVNLLHRGKLRSWVEAGEHFGVNRETLRNWSKEDREWGRTISGMLDGTLEKPTLPVPDIATFRKEYLGFDTPPHMQEWYDFIDSHRISLILVPPEHAKTQSVGIDYPVWRICGNRSVRMMYVCSNQTESRKRLNAVQSYLTEEIDDPERPHLKDLIADFGPFTSTRTQRSVRPWTSNFFTVEGSRVGQKDYTMQAVGLRGRIYGTRLDLIVLDDIVEDIVPEQEQERIISWLLGKALTRLSTDGKIVIIGTRVHEQDIYAQFLDDAADYTQNWAKMVKPAIDDDGNALWPEVWPVERLKAERMPPNMRERDWALIYQQQAVGLAGAPFPLDVLEASKDPARRVGHVPPGLPVVMGVDPATEGTCAITVLALDRATRTRYVVDVIGKANLGQREAIKAEIVYAARRYGAKRCRVEQNFSQLGDDPDLKQKLHDVGCTLEMWKTDAQNKYDPEWGVLGTAGRFAEGLFNIPAGPGSDQAMRPFINELAIWRPGTKRKQDRVMATWFADLSADKLGVFRPGLPRQHMDVPAWVRNKGVPEWVSG